MKRKPKMNVWPVMLLSVFVLGLSATSCGSKKEQNLPTVGESVALFDNFNYKGNDSYYTTNPLPDESCFYNPVLPGWYSDPSVCTNGEGDYFLATSTFSYFPGVPLFHSTDLVNWKQIGHILSRPSQLVNLPGQGVSGGIFAPAISYNSHNKTYYMITTNVGAGNFFVKTQDPFGEWSDPIMLPEVVGIDPSFFFDEDGKAYIVNNDDAPGNKPEYDGHRTIRVQEFDVKNDKTVGPRKILINKGVHPEDKPIWIEGPHMYKINGKYFLMAAEGGTGDGHSEVIFRGDSPMGKFVPWKNNPILTQRHLPAERLNPVTCVGHADLIQAKEGDWWAFFLACRPVENNYENLGRETFAIPVKWSEDGFPYMLRADELVPPVLERKNARRDSTMILGNFEMIEDFDDTELGMEWMTLRAPATELYSLTETPGWLTLKCAESPTTEKGTPAFVCRRLRHHVFECSTRMLFHPSDDTEKAGMLLFKDETHQYFLCVKNTNGQRTVAVERIAGKDNTTVLASQDVAGDAQVFDLRIVSKGTSFEFQYATQTGKWQSLCKDVDAEFLSTKVAGGFTGTTVGLYAVKQ